MTLQERYDAIKAEAQRLGQELQQGRAQMMRLEQLAIRADAQMALLEALMAEPVQTPPSAELTEGTA